MRRSRQFLTRHFMTRHFKQGVFRGAPGGDGGKDMLLHRDWLREAEQIKIARVQRDDEDALVLLFAAALDEDYF